MANSVEWNTWAIDFLQMLVHTHTQTDTLKMLSSLLIGRINSVCDLCSCSCLDTRIHLRSTNTYMINLNSACDELARITVKVMHGWCWYVFAFFIIIINSQQHDDHIFSCLFVCFFFIGVAFFSLIYSQWESLMELWLDWIGLNSFGFDFVFLIQFWFSIFFIFWIVLFVRLFRAILPIHRILFLRAHIIFANWSIKWLIKNL